MSNLQGWGYLEEELHRYFLEERLKHMEKDHVCDICANAADYVVSAYLANDREIEFEQQLCAKHTEKVVNFKSKTHYQFHNKLKFKQRPLEV